MSTLDYSGFAGYFHDDDEDDFDDVDAMWDDVDDPDETEAEAEHLDWLQKEDERLLREESDNERQERIFRECLAEMESQQRERDRLEAAGVPLPRYGRYRT